jgi:hypothetical protein
LFDFEPGQYTISYSWKCVGERTDAYNADYGKVYLAPVDKEIVAGKRISSYMDAVPGCIMLSNDNRGLNVSSKWNDVVVDVVFDEAVKYNLVIEWYNNASGGAQTPLAIDDISVRKVKCPMPESLQMIGDSAFYDCTGLEALEFPQGLQSIGSYGRCTKDNSSK